MNNKTTPKTWVEIHKANLLHNLAAFKKRLKKTSSIMAVIKANAYGHGLREIASILKNHPVMLGVDSLEEAICARAVAPKNEIMILGYIPKENMAQAIKEKFHISAYDKETIELIRSLIKNRAVKPRWLHTHLKIETGTNRLGIKPSQLKSIKSLPQIEGIYTHLADSENIKSDFYKKQLEELRMAGKILKEKNITPKFTHISCTAAILRGGSFGGNLVRLGIGLYGLWPSLELKRVFSRRINPHTKQGAVTGDSKIQTPAFGVGVNLRPVLSWKTRLVQIKEIGRGETVGYDRTHKATGKKNIGIIPVGYYDGYDRRLSGCGEVLVSGRMAKIAGRVCMNMTMIDLGRLNPKTGTEVVLIGKSGGEEISADEIAANAGTINYEVVSRINPLIPRKILQ